MKILKTTQVKEADAYTIENEPIASIDLMERAATNASKWILEKFTIEKNYVIFAGPGNNGGDGLVIARKLHEANKNVTVYIVEFTKKFSDDFKINYERLKKKNISIKHITDISQFPNYQEDTIIVDAIFGSGLSRPVLGFAGDVIKKINASKHYKTISIDIPSGLFGEENHHLPEQNIINADFTLTFEFPFLAFVFPENEKFVGEFIVIPIGISKEYIDTAETNYYLLEPADISEILLPRPRHSHKGNYGHGLLLAGGYGRMGAAVLSAKAAHRAGIGLLTAQVCSQCVDIMQISSPETMLLIDNKNYISTNFDTSKFNAVAIGPAIGFEKETVEMMKKLFAENPDKHFVIDADALTIVSKNPELLELIPENSVLTPHPKEFLRLTKKTKNNFERLQVQREFSRKHKVIVVLKGHHTAISLPDGRVYFNSTGNPGMATAGSGDVLTGIILGLLAQGYSPADAAKTGVYVHGFSGDIAADEIGENALTASDLIENSGYAFQSLLSNSSFQ